MIEKRVVFLDYLRVIAIFMVMLVHCCEPFYICGNGGLIATAADAWWLAVIDSACRAAVPLFVMTSAYLLFPIPATLSTGEFLRRRILRVLVPFALWCCVYVWWNDGSWSRMLFNFPLMTGGHLWFVPMLLGLYLLMPLLSPWAERASEREVRGWLLVWLFTTTFPYLRRLWFAWYGEPSYGVTPFLYGECPWNSFGTFHYVSGFFGYMLLGFWFRKFAAQWDWRATLIRAVPLWLVGMAIVVLPFVLRVGPFPYECPYSRVVLLETSWEFCSLGVAMTVGAYFLVVRKFTAAGNFYRRVILPLSGASYGVYLIHILILVPLIDWLRAVFPTPVTIIGGAICVYLSTSAVSLALRRIPRVGRWIAG